MTRSMLTKMGGAFIPSIQHYNNPTCHHHLLTTKELFSDTELSNNNENFPFILSLPSTTTGNNVAYHRRDKPTTVGTHRRVIKKYSLQPRRNANDNNNTIKDKFGHKSSSPIKMKEPSVRVLLSGYNKNMKYDEASTMMANCTIDDDKNHIVTPPLCYSPPRPRRHFSNNENVLSDDLPNIPFLVRRRPAAKPSTTSQEDAGFVTPKAHSAPCVNLHGISSLPFLPMLS